MMDDDERPLPPIDELKRQYDEERHYQDDRAAAEYAFALAVRLRDAGQLDEARQYAAECLRLAQGLRAESLDDVTADRMTLGGVPMPERFHDGVVRARLASLLSV